MSSPTHHWHSRGYLPHLESVGRTQAVTFRLADSLPKHAAEEVLRETDDAERRRKMEHFLDSGIGDCLLRSPEAAEKIESVLLAKDGDHYQLLAWVIMPNHVHAMVRSTPEHPLASIIQAWKSISARTLGGGTVWYRDYHDRLVRDADHFDACRSYIHLNPVRAKLVDDPRDWRWSSAWRQMPAKGAYDAG